MLDDFGNELENTESKMDSTMKKMAKVLNLNNGNSISHELNLRYTQTAHPFFPVMILR